MRSSTISSILINLLLLASVTWAWSMPDIFDGLLKRADTTSTASDSTASVTSATASDSTATTATTGTTASVNTASNTGTASGATSGASSGTSSGGSSGTSSGTSSGKTSGTSSGSKTTSSSSISVNPVDPAGGASMTYPASTSTTYYKIGNNVTMGWNYTSVQITPSAVDVIATCSLNKATYTLASNASYVNTTSITWDTDNYGSDSEYPLVTAEYTLIIYEAGTSPTEVASAGALGPASYTFGMYLPQSYTPLNEWTCVTCSAAISDMERQTFGFMITMAAITIATFTIFAGGFGAVL